MRIILHDILFDRLVVEVILQLRQRAPVAFTFVRKQFVHSVLAKVGQYHSDELPKCVTEQFVSDSFSHITKK